MSLILSCAWEDEAYLLSDRRAVRLNGVGHVVEVRESLPKLTRTRHGFLAAVGHAMLSIVAREEAGELTDDSPSILRRLVRDRARGALEAGWTGDVMRTQLVHLRLDPETGQPGLYVIDTDGPGHDSGPGNVWCCWPKIDLGRRDELYGELVRLVTTRRGLDLVRGLAEVAADAAEASEHIGADVNIGVLRPGVSAPFVTFSGDSRSLRTASDAELSRLGMVSHWAALAGGVR
jgi:hypothetical protein